MAKICKPNIGTVGTLCQTPPAYYQQSGSLVPIKIILILLLRYILCQHTINTLLLNVNTKVLNKNN